MTYRGRLLAAFAYVLVLVIVALTLPLALSTSHRVDREVRAQAADGAQIVAASASGRLARLSQLDALVTRVDHELGARVIIVGRSGSLLADSERVTGVVTGEGDVANRLDEGVALDRFVRDDKEVLVPHGSHTYL